MTDPAPSELPDPPAVSMQTMTITGLLVDVYGLDEVPANLTHVSVLWLHNPRLGDKARMAPMAKRVVGEYNKVRASGCTRGLIAAAFGMLALFCYYQEKEEGKGKRKEGFVKPSEVKYGRMRLDSCAVPGQLLLHHSTL